MGLCESRKEWPPPQTNAMCETLEMEWLAGRPVPGSTAASPRSKRSTLPVLLGEGRDDRLSTLAQPQVLHGEKKIIRWGGGLGRVRGAVPVEVAVAQSPAQHLPDFHLLLVVLLDFLFPIIDVLSKIWTRGGGGGGGEEGEGGG